MWSGVNSCWNISKMHVSKSLLFNHRYTIDFLLRELLLFYWANYICMFLVFLLFLYLISKSALSVGTHLNVDSLWCGMVSIVICDSGCHQFLFPPTWAILSVRALTDCTLTDSTVECHRLAPAGSFFFSLTTSCHAIGVNVSLCRWQVVEPAVAMGSSYFWCLSSNTLIPSMCYPLLSFLLYWQCGTYNCNLILIFWIYFCLCVFRL